MVDAFPLAWPSGRPRSRYRRSAPFRTTLAKARDGVMNEIRLLGGRLPIISANLELRLDGLPRANQSIPDDPGVAVYFTLKGKQHCFASDCWTWPQDNLRAIEKTIEALRGIARWGTGDMMERAFTGFEALPSPAQWWDVLGFDSPYGLTVEDIKDAHRKMAMHDHPDRGGTDADMASLNWARDAGISWLEEQKC